MTRALPIDVGWTLARARFGQRLAAAAAIALTGCASLMDVRLLATGRPDAVAYELSGADAAALQREAQRLCPQGGEVLRQAGHFQAPESDGSRWRGWANKAAGWVDPPERAAQLVVLCRVGAAQAQLPAAATRPEAAAVVTGAAALPVGPITVEW